MHHGQPSPFDLKKKEKEAELAAKIAEADAIVKSTIRKLSELNHLDHSFTQFICWWEPYSNHSFTQLTCWGEPYSVKYIDRSIRGHEITPRNHTTPFSICRRAGVQRPRREAPN